MGFSLRRGLAIALDGGPEKRLREGRPVSSVALLGGDYPGVRADMRVAPGDRVRAGQTLFVDRKRPEIRFSAPAAGVVEEVRLGHRRALDRIVIGIDGDICESFEPPRGSRESLQNILLASGCWTAFRTRPFGRIPDVDAKPAAIFVTAIETDPLAADAAVVLQPHLKALKLGLDALKLLTYGPVYLCQAPGDELAPGDDRLRVAYFAGPHPAGLPGTHIHRLMPASAARTVWHIGAQDVVAIGHLLETGRVWTECIVALAGPGLLQPGLVRTRLGASLDDLVAGETAGGAVRLVSGSVLSGRDSAWLGRYHSQVMVLHRDRPARPQSILAGYLGWLPRAAAGPIIPLESLDRALPRGFLAVPLMRALEVGDVETAQRLGCLELVEEDVALLSHLCPGGSDYGVLLRRVLDEIEGGRG